MTGAEERAKHKEGRAFTAWFTDLLHECDSCLLRDILRNQKENLWDEWKKVQPYQR